MVQIQEKQEDKLLKAVEMILENPEKIKSNVEKMKQNYKFKYKSEDEIKEKVVKKIISKYSSLASFSGGVTSLTSIIPGLGQVVAIFGGATTDIAVCMKFQIEMTMAIATLYGYEIDDINEKYLCFIIAGLGAINQVGKEAGKKTGEKAFIKMVQMYLKGGVLKAVKEIFKKIGITFTRKAMEKAIPFGVGVVIGATTNKAFTIYIGNKAIAFYETR